MHAPAEPVDLDVLVDGSAPDDHAPRPAQAGRRRRWPWLVAALAIVVAIVAFPVRMRLAVAQFDRLDARWNTAAGLDNTRSALISQLRSAATSEDRARLDAATAALDNELAGRLERLERATRSERIVDGSVRRVATAERRALAAAVTSLHEHRYAKLDPAGTVRRRLEQQRERWHRRPAAGPSPRPLTAAGPTLDALQHWLDEPTGAALVAVSDRHLVLLDVDRSLFRPFEPEVHADFLLARHGFLAVLDGATARAVTLDAGSPTSVTDLGPADSVFAAIDGDAVWLVQDHAPIPGGAGTHSVATKVDATGRQLARWEGSPVPASDPPPFTEDPIAETTAGLLVVHTGTLISMSLEIVHLDGSRGPTLTSVGFPFAASSGAVAWIDNRTPDHELHLWSATTQTDRTVANPPGYEVSGVGGFSADGSTFFAFYQDDDARPGGTRIGTVDVPSANDVRLGADLPTISLNDVEFAPDGHRLFLAGRGERPLSTYSLGDGSMRELRAHGFAVQQFAVIPR